MTKSEIEEIKEAARVNTVVARADIRHALYKVIRHIMGGEHFKSHGDDCLHNPLVLGRYTIKSESLVVNVDGKTVFVKVNVKRASKA